MLDHWKIATLFLMTFCVSSFASLVKTEGFILIFPPSFYENLSAFGLMSAFLVMTMMLKRWFLCLTGVSADKP